MERYRSGHNEAVLKTVCPNGRMGSNPILSAQGRPFEDVFFLASLSSLKGQEGGVLPRSDRVMSEPEKNIITTEAYA